MQFGYSTNDSDPIHSIDCPVRFIEYCNQTIQQSAIMGLLALSVKQSRM